MDNFIVVAALILGFAMGFIAAWLWREKLDHSKARSRDAVVDKLIDRMAHDHALAHKERTELYTRIQAWELHQNSPEPEPKKEKDPESPIEHKIWSSQELMQMNLRENSDGGYLDLRTGDLFENVEDAIAWRESLKKRGIRDDLSPHTVEEQGLEAALEEANERAGISTPKV